ncbi:hypothetical protein CDD81_7146 [Ophiocordyceps australis]|uniref:Magnesium transporter NIPA n=1 Tax=Ophiocordyceps australis TaxID=1399860 RepID=A0A2C5Y165_9HYPO|nr:hypothetical protein CDD81_7146 [Ophiocordyceps australis]
MVPPAAPTSVPPDPGQALKNWSSLIGIITAIVGNLLIALALNVQRYAHTRLRKERVGHQRRARAALGRKPTAASNGSGTYGALGGEADGSSNRLGPEGVHEDEADYEPDQPLRQPSPSSGSQEDDEPDNPASTYLKSPYWWLGQILITLGEMGNFLAYGFAPASIVSPLGVVALVANCIIAPVMFHERFRPRDFWGVVIAVAGVVTVVLSANQEETKLEPHDVWDAITTPAFEIYLGVTTLLILILMWASPRYGKRTILIDLGLVGLFGGYTALATKGVSSMLSSTLWRAFTTPVTYVLGTILLVTAIMQIRYVNKALQRFDSTQVIPIQFVLFTLCVILGSAILYRDFEKTTATQAAKFIGGCLLTFFGVFLITSGRQPQEDLDQEVLSDTDGVEETIGLRHHDGTSPVPVHAMSAPTPRAQSRRSSRLSRISFAENNKPDSIVDESDDSHMQQWPTTEGAMDLLGPEPNSSPLLRNPWREPWDLEEESGSREAVGESAVSSSLTPSNSLSETPHRQSPIRSGHLVEGPMASRPNLSLSRTASLSRTTSRRRSKTFISPSPLSSTVTTVVKDGFLGGGHDVPLYAPKTSLRRIRSTIRASLFPDGADGQDRRPAIGSMAMPASDNHVPLRGARETTAGPEAHTPHKRSRSFSGTLGHFFRLKKKSRGATHHDDQAGAAYEA